MFHIFSLLVSCASNISSCVKSRLGLEWQVISTATGEAMSLECSLHRLNWTKGDPELVLARVIPDVGLEIRSSENFKST